MSEKVDRRNYLKYVGAGIAGLAVGGALGYITAPGKIEKITETITKTETKTAAAATITQTVTKTETIAGPGATITKTLAPPTKEVPKEPLKIGVITILTGAGAMLFDPGLKALQMEVEKINAQGGILGRKIELVVRDSGGKADASVDFFKRLVTEDRVEYIISGSTSAEAVALAPVAEEMKTLLIIEEGTATKLFEEVDTSPKYVFRVANYDALDAICHALSIYKTWPDAKKFAVIGADYVWGHDEWNILTTVLKKLIPDFEIVAEGWPPLFSTDFTPHITKVMAAKPDVVELTLWGGDLVTCIKQGVGYGLFKQCRVSSVTGGEYIWGAGKDCPDGMLNTTRYYFNYPPWNRWSINKEFNEEFHRRYPDVHGGYPGFNCNSAYIAIHALKIAIEKAYSIAGEWPETENVVSALENLMVPGPGGYRYFRKEDHQSLGYAVSGLTKQDPKLGYAVLDPKWVVAPEEAAPPPGMKWKDFVASW
jgi:branched-chain amino acid transport system substrate-binding protein